MLQRLLRLAVMLAALAAPTEAQVPARYSLGNIVTLPDTLHEVTHGGRFRISIVRNAETPRERELLSIAERLIPPTDSVEASTAKLKGSGWVRAFAEAKLREGPRWWWREWDGVWLPYAVTGEAIAEYVARVRSLSTSPNPFATHNPGIEHRASVEHTGRISSMPTAEGFQAELNVRFQFYCGPLCALTFTHRRVVTFDARGNVVRIEGDHPPSMIVS